jgi:small subunit ribosomal protein S14
LGTVPGLAADLVAPQDFREWFFMAKTSQVARNDKRKRMVAQYAGKRAALKKIINSPESAPEEVQAACLELQAIPRNASPVRVKNRCALTGRARAHLRLFNLCRHEFRRLASLGQIPGVTKSSW